MNQNEGNFISLVCRESLLLDASKYVMDWSWFYNSRCWHSVRFSQSEQCVYLGYKMYSWVEAIGTF